MIVPSKQTIKYEKHSWDLFCSYEKEIYCNTIWIIQVHKQPDTQSLDHTWYSLCLINKSLHMSLDSRIRRDWIFVLNLSNRIVQCSWSLAPLCVRLSLHGSVITMRVYSMCGGKWVITTTMGTMWETCYFLRCTGIWQIKWNTKNTRWRCEKNENDNLSMIIFVKKMKMTIYLW